MLPSMNTIADIETLYARLGERDYEAVMSYLADDIVWIVATQRIDEIVQWVSRSQCLSRAFVESPSQALGAHNAPSASPMTAPTRTTMGQVRKTIPDGLPTGV